MLENKVARLESETGVMDRELDDIKQILAAHNVRFENGRNALEDLRKSVEGVQPKPTDWIKVGLAFLTIVSVLMGGQLWIQSNFESRPTRAEIESQIAPLQERTESVTRDIQTKTDSVKEEIRALKQSQAVQGEVVQRIEKTQEQTVQKLNTVLRRLPRN